VPALADDPPAAFEDGNPREGSRRRRRAVPVAEPQYLATGLLAASVAGSVLAIGALHLPVLLTVAAFAFGAAAVALHKHALGRDGLVLPVPALVCAALAGYTLLQAIPMPIRWLEVLAPASADVWQRSLLPFGSAGPRFASLSLDPGASMVEVLRWTTYAAVFTAASTISAHHSATWGLRIVLGSAVAAALVTLGHGLFDAKMVYGLYKPQFGAVPWHVGPLLNPNNLAGYLNLGALTGLGLMLGERPALPRWVLGLAVALVVGIEVTAASRAGVFSLLVGVVLLALFARRRAKEHHTDNRTANLMLGGAVAAGVGLAMLGATEKIWNELYDKDLSKLTMFLFVKPLVRDHAFFGIGRGAFESVFPVYRTTAGNIVYTHAENFIVQWVSEWGVPVALVALGFFAWAFAPRRMSALRSMSSAGAWCGIAALLLQNLLDLALEVPGVMIAASATLGALWGDRHRARARDAVRLPGPLTDAGALRVVAGVASVGVLVGLGALLFGLHDVESDRKEALKRLEASATDPASVRAFLRAAMSRHPAEPYFPLIGGALAFERRYESPIPWLERSLERAPVNGRAHLLLAEVLITKGLRKQALLELRLGLQDDPAIVGIAATLASHWTHSFDELLAAVPEGKPGSVMLSVLGGVLPRTTAEENELGRRCDLEAIQRDPLIIPPRLREANARLEALANPAPTSLCADRAACRKQITEQADAIAAIDASLSVPATLRARLLLIEGKPAEAVKMLEGACDLVTDRLVCLQARASAAAQVKAPALLDAAAKELLALACVTPIDCANIATWLAGIRLGRGEGGMALALLVRAAREDPNDEARWLRLADAASNAGAHGEALEALQKVARRRGGADPALKQRIETERSHVMDGLLTKPR
jgi:tetratricopeptide (TPR) repeat protein